MASEVKKFRDTRVDAANKSRDVLNSHKVDVLNKGRLNVLKSLDKIDTGPKRLQGHALSSPTSVSTDSSPFKKMTSLLDNDSARDDRAKSGLDSEDGVSKYRQRIEKVKGACKKGS
jgi:hypothetical protein